MLDVAFGVILERKHHHYHHSYGVSDSQSQHNIMSTMISEDIITEQVTSKSYFYNNLHYLRLTEYTNNNM